MIDRRRTDRPRASVRSLTAVALGACCLAIQAAPPGHLEPYPVRGIDSAVVRSGRPVPVGRVPSAPTVHALSRQESERAEQGLSVIESSSTAPSNVTASGGPTGCQINIECDDCNPCTSDLCDVGTGNCMNEARRECTSCDDGLFCNGTDKCNAGNCMDAGQEKEFQCVSGSNEGRACYDDSDPLNVCSPDLNDPNDICQLAFVNTDPCRYFPTLICDELEPITPGQSGACVWHCDADNDCDDDLACNGVETCVKNPSVAGHGGECVGDTTTPGDPCTTAADCQGAAPVCGGVCRPADAGPCGLTWGDSTVTCAEGDPVTCGPGRCCTPFGNDWLCERLTAEDCTAAGGLFLGVGDLAPTSFDDADVGGGLCLGFADETFPITGESFLCPKYSAGITGGNVVDVLGQAGAAACHPYWEIGDDYALSNCKEAKDTWYQVRTVRWVGGRVPGTGSRMQVTFYDKDGRFIGDRVTSPAVPGGIGRQTLVFTEELIIPCNGFVTIKPAIAITPHSQVEWAVTESVQVGTTDAFVYVRRHGFCTNAPGTGCNEDADCGGDGPCVITTGALADGKIAPLEPIAIPGGGAGLAIEIVGEKAPEPLGACCNPQAGGCTHELEWICREQGGTFLGVGTLCGVCSDDGFLYGQCTTDSDCWMCEGGKCDFHPPCPNGDADCPCGTCDQARICLPVPAACQVSACCDPVTAACTEVIGAFCEGDPLRPCFGDADCELNEECVAPCPPGSTPLGFGSICDPNCCGGLYGPGADTCAAADVAPISVPALGQPPLTVTITGNNKGATYGDYIDGTCPQRMFDEFGNMRDRGWWHAFQLDDCADVRIDFCCTAEISGEIHSPQPPIIFADCDPCTTAIQPKPTGLGSFPDIPIGIELDPSARGAPFCESPDIWYTFRDVPAGTYYVPVFSGVAGHFGDYQLHISASACQQAACCLPESVCIGGPLNGQTCGANEDCAPLKGDKVCVGDLNRPNELCCPDGVCDNDPDNPTCVGGTRDTLPCCDGGGECKGHCSADCAVTGKPSCESLDGYWMGFGNIPLGQSPAVSCDFGVCETGSCCLSVGDCRDDASVSCTWGVDCCDDGQQFCISRKACAEQAGEYVGGARCDFPRLPCPACDLQSDDNCHNLDGVNFTAISDFAALPGGFVKADDVVLASPQVNQICVWGIYFDGMDSTMEGHYCADRVIDKFRVRFYADGGGGKPDHNNILYDSWLANGGDPDDVPNTGWLTEANGGVAKSDTNTPTATIGNVDIPVFLQVYTLSFPTATLPTGETIWLEVANNTDELAGAGQPVRNTCYWWWAQSQQIFPGSDGTGNEWSYSGTEYRPVAFNPSPFSSRAGDTGYRELGHDWTDQVFCLSGPDGPTNFTEPAAPTGCCCNCDDTTDANLTLAECTSHDSNHERRWQRGTTCPDSCLPPQGVPGDECGFFTGSGTVAAGFDCAPPPIPDSAVEISDGALLADTVCAAAGTSDPFSPGNYLGGDFFAFYTASCTGELVMSMCNTGIFYGNYDSYLAVYHDFDNPENCPCPSSSLDFNVAAADENCNGEPDGGAGVIDGLIVFPGECWTARIGGWGGTLAGAAHGYARLDTACVHHDDCNVSQPPTLQTQFGGGGAPEPKSRFLAVNAGEPFAHQAIRVTWDSMPNWPGGHAALNGQKKYMTQPFQVCENSSMGLGVGPPNCSPAPGQPQRWFWAAELSCDPELAWFGELADLADYCTGSGEACITDADCAQGTCGVDGVIHLFDPGIAPSRNVGGNPRPARYSIQTVLNRCPLNLESSYSTPLTTDTAGWGDVGQTLGCPLGPPNGSTDMIPDVTEAINKFSNNLCAPKKTRVDMDHDFQVNFPTDVLMILNAFAAGGGGFPEVAPVACSAATKVTRETGRTR